MENTKAEVKEKSKLSSILADYRGEFKRIIWPTRSELLKNTVTVIITCILFGIVIFGFDLVFNWFMELFINMVS